MDPARVPYDDEKERKKEKEKEGEERKERKEYERKTTKANKKREKGNRQGNNNNEQQEKGKKEKEKKKKKWRERRERRRNAEWPEDKKIREESEGRARVCTRPGACVHALTAPKSDENTNGPERAMVPRCDTKSSLVMPIPKSCKAKWGWNG